MKTLSFIIGGLLVCALLVFGASISIKNSLIRSDENVNENWSQINTQLQRRADIIPNLVAVVKGYAAHESEVFSDIAEARSKLMGAGTPVEAAEASTEVSSALSRLLVVVENYPTLKADSSFLKLQDEIAGTENRIGVARTRYNGAVRAFNQSIRVFPGSYFAPRLGFVSREYFEPKDINYILTPPKVEF